MKHKDLTGQTFERLTAIRVAGKTKGGMVWECECSCGAVCTAIARDLNRGHKRSCGCIRIKYTPREMRAKLRLRAMEQRCFNPNRKQYQDYGGRGVIVCAGWRGQPHVFLADMGEPPTPKHSIDRKDNDGNYSCGHCEECIANGWPANCRWATTKEQLRNTRRNRVLTKEGETKCVTAWAEEAGVNPITAFKRLRMGIKAPDEVLSPVKPPVMLEYNGQVKALEEWAEELGLADSTIRGRLGRGWSVSLALATVPRKAKTLTVGGVTKSIVEWAAAAGISRASMRDRLANGWSPEDAVTTGPMASGRKPRVA